MYRTSIQIGDTVRSWDFQPFPGRPDQYVEGMIIGTRADGCWMIDVNKDSTGRKRDIVFTPKDLSLSDWAGRIEVLVKGEG